MRLHLESYILSWNGLDPKDLEDLANLFGYTLKPIKKTQDIEKRAEESPFKKTIVTDGDSM